MTNDETISRVKRAVAQSWDITVEQLDGPRGNFTVSDARTAAVRLTRSSVKMTTNEIGKRFNRNGSSVRYMILKVGDLLETNEAFKTRYERAKQNI